MTKKYIVYFEQTELFSVEVEAANKKEAEEKATLEFSNGNYTETGHLEVGVYNIDVL